MNKKSWLIVGLSLAMAATLGVGISACGGGKDPDTPEHTHEYTKWQHNDTQHWMVCPDDDAIWAQGKVDHTFKDGECECGAKEGEKHTHDFTEWKHDETQHWMVCPTDGEIWEQGKVDHDFTNGDCVCGMENPDGGDETPDADLDTRLFYVVGSGAGDLKSCSFTELIPSFQLTKQPKKDENGYTVYKTAALTLYAGDTMKIVQDLKWDDAGGLGYFSVGSIKNNDGTFVDGGTGNISPATGKDGKYIFTVRTKPDITFAECTLEFELVEPVAALTKTEEIYIVGSLRYYTTKWPSGTDVSGCLKLNYDEAAGEWSIVLRLGGATNELGKNDEFKLYNSVNGKYYPDGTGNNWTVSGTTDATHRKASGDYKISWKAGDTDVTFTKLEHTHVYDRQMKNDTQHWNLCWLDDTEEESSRENHVYTDDQDATCNTCGYKRHVHTYDQWGRNETQHWKQCEEDGAIDESTRENHTFDQEGDKCVCGQEQGAEACKHDGEIKFNYTSENAPEVVEAGGTLKGTCATCSEEVDVTYDVGLTNTVEKDMQKQFIPTTVETGKSYYVQSTTDGQFKGGIFGVRIPDGAGTLTFKMYVIVKAGTESTGNMLQGLYLTDKFELGTAMGLFDLLGLHCLANNNAIQSNIATWFDGWTADRLLLELTDGTNTTSKTVKSFRLRMEAEDTMRNCYFEIFAEAGSKLYFELDFVPAAAPVSAPVEVAMLPEKKD